MRAKRVDQNHGTIIDALRAAGFLVFDTSAVGRGFPDTCCKYRGVCLLLEIKDGAKPKSARKLTEPQEEFWKDWSDVCYLIEGEQDVLDLKAKLDFDLKGWR